MYVDLPSNSTIGAIKLPIIAPPNPYCSSVNRFNTIMKLRKVMKISAPDCRKLNTIIQSPNHDFRQVRSTLMLLNYYL